MSKNNNNNNNKHAFGWNCKSCTFYHAVRATRCTMCNELRGASRKEMHDFVLGKPIAPVVEGNVVEIIGNNNTPTPPDKNSKNDSNKKDNDTDNEEDIEKTDQQQQQLPPSNQMEIINGNNDKGNKVPVHQQNLNSNNNNNNNNVSKENRHNHRTSPPLSRPKTATTAATTGGVAATTKSGGANANNIERVFQQNRNVQTETNNPYNNNNNNNSNNNRVRNNPYLLAGRQKQQHQQQQQQQANPGALHQKTTATINPQQKNLNHHQQLHQQQQQQQQHPKPQNQIQLYNEQQQQQQQNRQEHSDFRRNNGSGNNNDNGYNNNNDNNNSNNDNSNINNNSNNNNQEQNSKPHSFFDKNSTKTKKSNTTTKTTRRDSSIHRFGFAMGPVAVDEETASTYIYPKHPDFPERQYQSEMTETALNYNTLVSLPTGLGKTHIAAVVMYNYYRWFAKGGGKIIFCAPTLPLVNQQLEACFSVVGIPGSDTAVMTGKINAEQRKELWKTKRLFFCTPQTVQRDLMTACNINPTENDENNNNSTSERQGTDTNNNKNKNNSDDEIDHETSRAFSKVVCLVLDEAHKASGDYAYTRVVELLENAAHAKFRIVGLSATPGTTIKAIQGVIEALRSVKIEARTDTDDTVAPYLHTKRTELVVVERNSYQREIERLISNILHPYLAKLRDDQLLLSYGNASLTSYSILKGLETYKKNNVGNFQGSIMATFYAVRQLVEVQNDCRQSLGVVKTKLFRLRQGPNRGILSKIVKSEEFGSLVEKVIEATGGVEGEVNGAGGGGGGNNPKLIKLCELLKLHFERENACGNSSRAIVFAQFRDSVKEIVDCLKRMDPLVRSKCFVGQNKGSNNSKKNKKRNATNDNNNNDDTTSAVPFLDERVAGMKQAEQHQAIKDFRNNRFNVLVCTSIGEEGLDIGDVDLIINYDVIRSPIRTIQRAGRTGRKRDGRVVSLISEGQEEQTHKKRLSAERTLVNALKNPKKFIMANHHPMLPNPPIREYKTMEIASRLKMSDVAGAQQTPSSTKRGSSSKEDKNAWRLDAVQEEERQYKFGDIVSFDGDVTWNRLRRFFCKNRVDPSKLPRDKHNQLQEHHQREQSLRRRQKIRLQLQKDKPIGRNQCILNSLKRYGPIHSSGTTRSGYRDILEIFPIDPVKEDDIKKSYRNSMSGVKKNMWGNQSSITHPSASSSSIPTALESRAINSIDTVVDASNVQKQSTSTTNTTKEKNRNEFLARTILGESIAPAPAPAAAVPLNENGKSDDISRIRIHNAPAQSLDRELPGVTATAATSLKSGSNKRICVGSVGDGFDAHQSTNDPSTNCLNAVNPRPLPQDSSATEKESPPVQDQLPDQNENVKIIFRLPTPPPSSSEDEDGSDEDNDDDDNNGEPMPQPAAFQQVHVQDEEGNNVNVPHQASAAFQVALENIDENVVFRLPTPPPSSSEDEDDGSDDDSDSEPTPRPTGFREELGQGKKKHQNICLDGQREGVIVEHESCITGRLQESSNEEEKVKTTENVTKDEIAADCKNEEKLDLGFDDEKDSALSSLKCKPKSVKKKKKSGSSKIAERPKKSADEEKIKPMDKATKDQFASTSEKQGKRSLGFDGKADSALSSLKCKSIVNKKESGPRKLGCDESEKEKKSNISQKLFVSKEAAPLASDSDGNNKKMVPLSKKPDDTLPLDSVGRSHNFNNDYGEQSSKKRKIEGNEEQAEDDSESDDDIPLATFKKRPSESSHYTPEEEGEPEAEESQVKHAQSRMQERTKQVDATCGNKHRYDHELSDHNSQDVIVNHNKNALASNRNRILETPESKSIQSNIGSLSQIASQNSIINHLKAGKKYKRIRIGTTDSDEENDTAIASDIFNDDEPKLFYQNMTPSTFTNKLNVLEDTPETTGIKSKLSTLEDAHENDLGEKNVHNQSNKDKKRSVADFLTDTPSTNIDVDIDVDDLFCQVCRSSDSTDEDPIVLCDACNLGFHKHCYSIEIDDVDSDEKPWFCDPCKNRSTVSLSTNVACTYCCQREGALLKAENVLYHPMCSVFSSKISSATCSACSLHGAVQCDGNKCSDAIHPYCAMSSGWTIVHAHSTTNQSSQIFCPKHSDNLTQLSGVRIIKKKRNNKTNNADLQSRPKKLQKKSAKVQMSTTASARSKNEEEENFDEEAAKKERLKRRRQGLARFVLQEAEVGSDQEGDDEEDEVRRIEEDEEYCSQDSFINDNAALTQHFSQDHLGRIDPDATDATEFDYGNSISHAHASNDDDHNHHRVLDTRREFENQFRTPDFNRRMIRHRQQPGSSSSDNNAPSSQRGLGNMNFIRSVLEHHREGGDCDQIESYYNRMTGEEGRRTENIISSPFITAAAAAAATHGTPPTSIMTAHGTTSSTNNNNQPVIDLSSPENNNNENSTLPNTDGGGGGGGIRSTCTNYDNNNKIPGRQVPTKHSENNHMKLNNNNNATSLMLPPNNAPATAPPPPPLPVRKPVPSSSSGSSSSGTGGGLTAEQKNRIEANRQAALQRRKEFQARNAKK